MATLIDAYTRQQVYIEGVKNYQRQKYDKAFDEIEAVVAGLLVAVSVRDMNKRVFKQFLQKISIRVKGILEKFIGRTKKDLQTIMRVTRSVNRSILNRAVGRDDDLEDYNEKVVSSLWASIEGETIPANGLTTTEALSAMIGVTVADILAILKRARADNLTAQETTALLFAPNASFPRRNRNQQGSMIETIVQHVTSFVTATMAAFYAKSYQWVSILDSRTTSICRFRAGKIYEWGLGPRPPAHYNCRSIVVPYLAGIMGEMPATFYAWITKQPAQFQNEALGTRLAAGVRSGKVRSDDMPRFIGSPSLSPTEFGKKLSIINA